MPVMNIQTRSPSVGWLRLLAVVVLAGSVATSAFALDPPQPPRQPGAASGTPNQRDGTTSRPGEQHRPDNRKIARPGQHGTPGAIGRPNQPNSPQRSDPHTPGIPQITESPPLKVDNPKGTILVIFNHGSMVETFADRCFPDYRATRSTTPKVIGELDGRKLGDKMLQVYSYCTPSKFGEYNGNTRQGEPKVQKRAKDIEALIVEALAQGVPPEQIFVAGHSAGAWASLIVARRGQVRIGGYILFAPAFAGHYSVRHPGWWDLQNRLVKYIGEAERIDALVYAFENDKFNRVEDLRFLDRVKGIQFFALQSSEVDGVACARQDGHETVYQECFRTTRNAEILNFILKRARVASR